jgi:hypothetical protein
MKNQLLNMLSGLFNDGATGGAFKAMATTSFVEDLTTQTTDHLIDSDMIDDAIALLGEQASRLRNGAGVIAMHSTIHKALKKQDKIDFERPSQMPIALGYYEGLPIIIDDDLVRVGTTSGNVYHTYIFTERSIAMTDRPQVTYAGAPESVASIVRDVDNDKNDAYLWDRTSCILHPAGAKWVGTTNPITSGTSPTDAHLATATNWSLAYGDVKNVGIIQINTNG